VFDDLEFLKNIIFNVITYVKLQDLHFLKTQLFDKVIARCFKKTIDLRENCHQPVKLQVLHFDLNKLIRYWKMEGRLCEVKRALAVVMHQSLCKWFSQKNYLCRLIYLAQSRVKHGNDWALLFFGGTFTLWQRVWISKRAYWQYKTI